MNAIKMNRKELLEIVRVNLLKHLVEYDESVIDYKALILQYAKANLSLAKSGDLKEFSKIRNMPPAPQSYVDSYKRAVRMLELSVEDVIDIEQDIFNQLVLDEWTWKRGFVAASTMYKTGL